MDGPITIGGALLTFLVLLGLLIAAFGFLETMAGASTSAPAKADQLVKSGCITWAIGAAIVTASILWAILS